MTAHEFPQSLAGTAGGDQPPTQPIDISAILEANNEVVVTARA